MITPFAPKKLDPNYQILLFYKYVDIPNPQALVEDQKKLCQSLDLKGRIIIAKEGINATLEGTIKNTQKYIKNLFKDPLFKKIHIKKSTGTGSAFPKLSVKLRDEIVATHLGEDDIDPKKLTGKYLTPKKLHHWFATGKKFYIVDMRNDYEYKSGHFDNSFFTGMTNFRDLPQIPQKLAHLKDETILTVCTGGVRCEKASGFLLKHDFKNVYQLYGGIVSYMEKYPNQDFKGKLYVFDQRLLMGFNTDSKDHQIIARCDLCQNLSENYVNCANDLCHKHFICCQNCYINNLPYCESCQDKTPTSNR